MSKQKGQKLNRLYQLLPPGLLADAAWLERHGYSSALRHKYVSSGWLEQPARGVYARPGEPLKWRQVVASMQRLLQWPVIVGGRTALNEQGYAHYVEFNGQSKIHLYADVSEPSWLAKLGTPETFVLHNAARLFGKGSADLTDAQPSETDGAHFGLGLTQRSIDPWDTPLVMSAPERAVLELLDELPSNETFHQVDMIFESLQNLRPRHLQSLLAACQSVKVKRLFFWFAHRHQPAWLKHLDVNAVDLGSGKRMIVRGGKYDATFKITVPEDMYADA